MRRQRVVASIFIALASLGLVATAHKASAADESMLFQKRERTFESPQHFAFELRLGPYIPDIDSDPALKGKDPWHQTFGDPYQSAFGTSQRLLVAAELDWQFLRFPHVGSLGAGASFGYTSMSATARRADNGLPLTGETTSLDVYPMYAVVVFRYDALNKDFGIPLVPYAKAGLGMALWRSSTDIGTSKSPSGEQGEGHTYGYQVAGGVGLDLNAFDRSAAHAFDESMGVNHTYIYAEWMFMALDGIGQSTALRVGSSTWVSGLALEF